MKLRQIAMLLICFSFILTCSVGCSQEGDAEKAGKQIDKAMESAKDKFKEATK